MRAIVLEKFAGWTATRNKLKCIQMNALPLIVFDVNETLLDLTTMRIGRDPVAKHVVFVDG